MGAFDAWGFFPSRQIIIEEAPQLRQAAFSHCGSSMPPSANQTNRHTIDASVGHPEVNPADVVARSQFLARTFQNDPPRFHHVRRPRDRERIVGGLGR